jgi:uncharacterized membrane protein (DUF485 family)
MTTISSFTRAPETEHPGAHVPGGKRSLADAEGNPDFAAIRDDPDFQRIRGRLLRFTVPLTLAFLAWYLTYVLLAAYAPDLMSYRVTGRITVGLLLGLSQFVSTVVIMLMYLRFARRRVDPEVAELRARVEGRR